jgi:hypothetical protein
MFIESPAKHRHANIYIRCNKCGLGDECRENDARWDCTLPIALCGKGIALEKVLLLHHYT